MELKRKSTCTEFTVQLEGGKIITYTEFYDNIGVICSYKIDDEYMDLVEEIQDLIDNSNN